MHAVLNKSDGVTKHQCVKLVPQAGKLIVPMLKLYFLYILPNTESGDVTFK